MAYAYHRREFTHYIRYVDKKIQNQEHSKIDWHGLQIFIFIFSKNWNISSLFGPSEILVPCSQFRTRLGQIFSWGTCGFIGPIYHTLFNISSQSSIRSKRGLGFLSYQLSNEKHAHCSIILVLTKNKNWSITWEVQKRLRRTLQIYWHTPKKKTKKQKTNLQLHTHGNNALKGDWGEIITW